MQVSTDSAQMTTTNRNKRRAPSLPSSSTGYVDVTRYNVAEAADGSGASVGDTEYNLTVILMDGRHVNIVVDSNLSMIDLLVLLCCRLHVSPADHAIQIRNEPASRYPLPYTASQSLHSLGVNTVHLISKKATDRRRTSPDQLVPFEMTHRVTINLPYNQKHVVRVRPDIILQDLFKMAVEHRNLDPSLYELRHPTTPQVLLDLGAPLNRYALTQVSVVEKNTASFRNAIVSSNADLRQPVCGVKSPEITQSSSNEFVQSSHFNENGLYRSTKTVFPVSSSALRSLTDMSSAEAAIDTANSPKKKGFLKTLFNGKKPMNKRQSVATSQVREDANNSGASTLPNHATWTEGVVHSGPLQDLSLSQSQAPPADGNATAVPPPRHKRQAPCPPSLTVESRASMPAMQSAVINGVSVVVSSGTTSTNVIFGGDGANSPSSSLSSGFEEGQLASPSISPSAASSPVDVVIESPVQQTERGNSPVAEIHAVRGERSRRRAPDPPADFPKSHPLQTSSADKVAVDFFLTENVLRQDQDVELDASRVVYEEPPRPKPHRRYHLRERHEESPIEEDVPVVDVSSPQTPSPTAVIHQSRTDGVEPVYTKVNKAQLLIVGPTVEAVSESRQQSGNSGSSLTRNDDSEFDINKLEFPMPTPPIAGSTKKTVYIVEKPGVSAIKNVESAQANSYNWIEPRLSDKQSTSMVNDKIKQGTKIFNQASASSVVLEDHEQRDSKENEFGSSVEVVMDALKNSVGLYTYSVGNMPSARPERPFIDVSPVTPAGETQHPKRIMVVERIENESSMNKSATQGNGREGKPIKNDDVVGLRETRRLKSGVSFTSDGDEEVDAFNHGEVERDRLIGDPYAAARSLAAVTNRNDTEQECVSHSPGSSQLAISSSVTSEAAMTVGSNNRGQVEQKSSAITRIQIGPSSAVISEVYSTGGKSSFSKPSADEHPRQNGTDQRMTSSGEHELALSRTPSSLTEYVADLSGRQSISGDVVSATPSTIPQRVADVEVTTPNLESLINPVVGEAYYSEKVRNVQMEDVERVQVDKLSNTAVYSGITLRKEETSENELMKQLVQEPISDKTLNNIELLSSSEKNARGPDNVTFNGISSSPRKLDVTLNTDPNLSKSSGSGSEHFESASSQTEVNNDKSITKPSNTIVYSGVTLRQGEPSENELVKQLVQEPIVVAFSIDSDKTMNNNEFLSSGEKKMTENARGPDNVTLNGISSSPRKLDLSRNPDPSLSKSSGSGSENFKSASSQTEVKHSKPIRNLENATNVNASLDQKRDLERSISRQSGKLEIRSASNNPSHLTYNSLGNVPRQDEQRTSAVKSRNIAPITSKTADELSAKDEKETVNQEQPKQSAVLVNNSLKRLSLNIRVSATLQQAVKNATSQPEQPLKVSERGNERSTSNKQEVGTVESYNSKWIDDAELHQHSKSKVAEAEAAPKQHESLKAVLADGKQSKVSLPQSRQVLKGSERLEYNASYNGGSSVNRKMNVANTQSASVIPMAMASPSQSPATKTVVSTTTPHAAVEVSGLIERRPLPAQVTPVGIKLSGGKPMTKEQVKTDTPPGKVNSDANVNVSSTHKVLGSTKQQQALQHSQSLTNFPQKVVNASNTSLDDNENINTLPGVYYGGVKLKTVAKPVNSSFITPTSQAATSDQTSDVVKESRQMAKLTPVVNAAKEANHAAIVNGQTVGKVSTAENTSNRDLILISSEKPPSVRPSGIASSSKVGVVKEVRIQSLTAPIDDGKVVAPAAGSVIVKTGSMRKTNDTLDPKSVQTTRSDNNTSLNRRNPLAPEISLLTKTPPISSSSTGVTVANSKTQKTPLTKNASDMKMATNGGSPAAVFGVTLKPKPVTISTELSGTQMQLPPSPGTTNNSVPSQQTSLSNSTELSGTQRSTTDSQRSSITTDSNTNAFVALKPRPVEPERGPRNESLNSSGTPNEVSTLRSVKPRQQSSRVIEPPPLTMHEQLMQAIRSAGGLASGEISSSDSTLNHSKRTTKPSFSSNSSNNGDSSSEFVSSPNSSDDPSYSKIFSPPPPPPPPPPPLTDAAPVPDNAKTTKARYRLLDPPKLSPRDELMLAIRNAAGKPKMSTSATSDYGDVSHSKASAVPFTTNCDVTSFVQGSTSNASVVKSGVPASAVLNGTSTVASHVSVVPAAPAMTIPSPPAGWPTNASTGSLLSATKSSTPFRSGRSIPP